MAHCVPLPKLLGRREEAGAMLAGGRDAFLEQEAVPAEQLKESLPRAQAAISHHGHKFIRSCEQHLQVAFQGRSVTLNL